jgi:hypothetical protein
MTDIEMLLRDTLHADAEVVAPPADLPERALTRAAHLKRRRRATGAVAAAAVAVLGVSVAVPLLGPTPPSPDHVASEIGTDPGMLHFDVDSVAMKGSVQYVGTGPGYEMILVYRKPHRGNPEPVIRIYLATSTAAMAKAREDGWWASPDFYVTEEWSKASVTVAGKPGTIERQKAKQNTQPQNTQWVIRWEPEPGVQGVLVAHGDDREAALAAVDAVLLDGTRPCLLQFRLTDLPPGWKQTSCRFVYVSGPRKNPATAATWQKDSATLRVDAGLKLGWTSEKPDIVVDGAGGEWWATTQLPGRPSADPSGGPSADPSDRPLPDPSAERQPAKLPTGGVLIFPDLHGGNLTIEGVDKAAAFDVARNIDFAEDPDDAETWPR